MWVRVTLTFRVVCGFFAFGYWHWSESMVLELHDLKGYQLVTVLA